MTETPSPFLPGTNVQFAWDSTSLGYFKTCPRLYQYTMIDGWSGKGESVHLRWGGEFHTALQEYSLMKAEGWEHEEALRYVVYQLLCWTHGWEPEIDLEKRSQKLKTKDHLFRTVIDYVDHFEEDPAQTYIMGGGEAAVELSFKFELDWGPEAGNMGGTFVSVDGVHSIYETPASQPYLLSGHLDRVVNYQGALFVMDHKTTVTTPSSYYFAQFEPSNQMTLYTLAGQVVLGTPIRGVIIDAVQIMADETRMVRSFTYRTKDQLGEWLNDLKHHLRLAETYATEGYWPMNDTACDKFGGCRFREICSKSPGVRENFLKADFVKLAPEERWNPLKPRTVMND